MKLFVISVLILFAQSVSAQEKLLPVDERGVYTFLEVAEVRLDQQQLPARVKQFFKSNSKSLKLHAFEGDTTFSGVGKLILFRGNTGVGRPAAEASFNVSISLKKNKYRLILTDYVITPYERDRYANFVPSTVKYRLEDKPGKLNKAEWERNMKLVMAESAKLASKLKMQLNSSSPAAASDVRKPDAVSTTNW